MAKKRRQGVSGNPARAAAAARDEVAPAPTPERSSGRAAFERGSAPVLLFLSRLPRWAFPLLMGLVLLAGMLVPSAVLGGILLSLLVLVLLWLVLLSWPLIGPGSRALRLLVVAGLGLVAFGRFTGRFG